MFFKSIPSNLSDAVGELGLVDVGGYGDSGFRSVAVGIIDALPHVDEDILKKIFEQYYRYFPQNIPPKESSSLTASERMDFLLNEHRNTLSQLIINLAHVLRQIAVNEMVAHPYDYLGAFVDNHENTSVESMRKKHSYIDQSAIAALAFAINIRIEVAVVEKNKDLPLHLTFNKEAKTAVSLQLEGKSYKSKVINSLRFQSVANKSSLTEPTFVEHDDRPMEEILKDIEAELAKGRLAFEEMHDTLSIMVAEGELTKRDLIELYVQHMPKSDYLSGRVGEVAKEYNNQDFFVSALRQPSNTAKTNNDDHIMAELIHALSRAHVIGELAISDLPIAQGLKL